VKVEDIRPGNRTFNLIVKVVSFNAEATREEKRGGGRTITASFAEALVGDETGVINLSTRFPERTAELKVGATLALLNVRIRRIGGDQSWIELDQWSTIKPADNVKEILPADYKLDFEVNKDKDRSRKIPAKPVFSSVKTLEPDERGIHLLIKVVEILKVDERKRGDGAVNTTAQAVVGDETARVTLVAKSAHAPAIVKDALLAVFNAHIEMYNKGFMRLVVDRWSDVKPLADVDAAILPAGHLTAETVIAATDKSAQEWVLEDAA
jgi:hypothetical protein